MNRKKLWLVLPAVLAFILVLAAVGQQKSGDTAIDPVCGMTVVKANAKATYDYKGTTYYFCSAGCKESFAKDPEKYFKAQTKGEEPEAPMGGMHGTHMGQAPMPEGRPMAGCPMMARRMPMRPMRPMRGRMPMMHRGMGMGGHMPMIGMGCGADCPLHGPDVEWTVEKTKDGVTVKVTSKNAETVKAIQEHMTEHVATMKKMKEEAAKASEAGACANCPMKK